MAGRSYSLQEAQRASTGQTKKRFALSENETEFLTEELEDTDSPEELLLPDEHQDQKDPILMKWLSSTTLSENEEERDARPSIKKESGVFSRIKLTSSCLCKLFVVLYLLGCLLVSTLYIAIYGPNELYLMPEPSNNKIVKPPVTPEPILRFYDNPYTEWISQRWTYDKEPFADWPALPEYISTLQQTISGEIDSKKGVWLLDSEGLYFMYGVGAKNYEDTAFVNISDNLDLPIHEGSRLLSRNSNSLYVLSSDDVTLLDCSPASVDYCDISYHWSVPDLAPISSAVVSGRDGHVWIGTENGLYRLNTTHPSQAPASMATGSNNNNNNVFFSDENSTSNTQVSLIPGIEGPVLSLAWRGGLLGPKGWGLESSAFLLTNSSHLHPQDVSFSSGADYYSGGSDAPDQFGLLAIGTPKRIYFYDGHVTWFEWVSVWEEGIGGVIDGWPTAMTFVPSGELFIGNNVSLSRLNIDYTFDTLSGSEGLPYNQITTLRYSSFSPVYPSPLIQLSASETPPTSKGTIWVGTKKGWSLFDIMNSKFVGYFLGPRWHPGEFVKGISGVGVETTVVLTDKGLAVVDAEEWTLEMKAEHYQDMLGRHVRDPGLVADCSLSDFIPISCHPGPTDNDGLWTSWLVAAEALRYKVTKSDEARANAWRFYRGLKFLVDVTGITGLPARSVVKVNTSSKEEDDYGESGLGEDSNPPAANASVVVPNTSSYDPQWHNSSTKPGWIWKGDTSSDEIVGHIFANTMAYDLLAQSEEEKQEVRTVLDSIMENIKDNNYTLKDITNRTTRWGVWTPSVINFNQTWGDEHGLNSLEILSGLLSAFRITGKVEYMEAWQELFNGSYDGVPCHYGLNMINQKITFPSDINYSDDELAFLPYFVYFQTLKRLATSDSHFSAPEMFFIPMLSLNRAWNSVKKERSAAWHSIYGNITGDPGLTEDIVWSLRNWPLELVQWRTQNSHRLDIQLRRGEDRFGRSKSQSQRVLSPRERTQLRWDGNPFSLDFDGSSNEMDPGPWLTSYWLARWNRLL